MKKKLISVLLIAALTISLSACGSNSSDKRIKELEDQITDLQNQLDEARAEDSEESPAKEEEAPRIEHEVKDEEEFISDEEIFMQFINGETMAMVDADFKDGLSYACVIYDYEPGNLSYTFDITGTLSYSDLINAIEESDIMFMDPAKIEKSYAVANTVSGEPVLAVRFGNLGIYTEDDDSYALFFFMVNDGQLYMTYAYDSWARNSIDVYDNMVFMGYGSGGAGDNFNWCFYIDENGHYKPVFDIEILFGEWVASYGSYELDMDSAESWSEGCTVYLLTTSKGNFYAYDAEDLTDTEQLAVFTRLLEEKGMSRIDDVGDMVNDAYESNGISIDSLSYFEDWIVG